MQTWMKRPAQALAGAIAIALFGTPLNAQAPQTTPPAAGWTFTPSLGVGSTWDDNALLRSSLDTPAADLVTVLNPRGVVDFTGKRGRVDASYDGAFLVYRELGSLDSYDQHASLSMQRAVTKHVTLFANDSFAASPTTQMTELVGLPYVRDGSVLESLTGGVNAALTKRTSVTASYLFQIVRFDATQPIDTVLSGGHSNGLTFSLRHILTDRAAFTTDYDHQYATVAEFPEVFDVQNGSAGIDYRVTNLVRAFVAVGVSRLGVSTAGPARTGPSWRMGVSRGIERGALDVVYSRSFVPSYGFGGTVQNEELTGHANLQLTRTISTQSSLSWQRNESLIPGEPRLASVWVQASIGYALAPWARVEGFYDGTHQSIDRPGGVLDRSRMGFQIVTTKPMRLR